MHCFLGVQIRPHILRRFISRNIDKVCFWCICYLVSLSLLILLICHILGELLDFQIPMNQPFTTPIYGFIICAEMFCWPYIVVLMISGPRLTASTGLLPRPAHNASKHMVISYDHFAIMVTVWMSECESMAVVNWIHHTGIGKIQTIPWDLQVPRVQPVLLYSIQTLVLGFG